MEITSANLKNFRNDFESSVKELSLKYGVQIDLGGIKFSANEFHSKLTVKNSVVNGVDFEEADFKRYAKLYGFGEADYNKLVRIQSKMFQFVGFKLNSRKNVCKIREVESGKEYSCSENTIKLSSVNG